MLSKATIAALNQDSPFDAARRIINRGSGDEKRKRTRKGATLTGYACAAEYRAEIGLLLGGRTVHAIFGREETGLRFLRAEDRVSGDPIDLSDADVATARKGMERHLARYHKA